MFSRSNAARRMWYPLALLLFFLASPAIAGDADGSCEIGLRGGTDSGRVEEDYTAAELYFLKDLPWSVDITNGIRFRPRFDIGAFYLEADSDGGEMFAAGFDLVLTVRDRFDFEIGFRPTWMTDSRYGVDDFGGETQFTSHVGLAFTKNSLVCTYRFQHTSNGGLYDNNPGLNLHLFGLGYRF